VETVNVPNDAKLGMIVGVGLVLAIAVVFFRKDGPAAPAGPEATPAGNVPSSNLAAPSVSRSARAAKAQTAIGNESGVARVQRHIVAEGETLFSLAKRYYHDEKKFVEIFKVNLDVLSSPDTLAPGTVLIIPALKD
jgi:nucleoid-associated protein YgaU